MTVARPARTQLCRTLQPPAVRPPAAQPLSGSPERTAGPSIRTAGIGLFLEAFRISVRSRLQGGRLLYERGQHGAPFRSGLFGLRRESLAEALAQGPKKDLDAIIEYAKHARRCAVIGGGLLGLEAAKAAYDLGLETHVIEFAPRLMPRQIDDAGSHLLVQKIQALGVHLHSEKATRKVLGNGKVRAMVFADGAALEADMIIVSAGIRPRDESASQPPTIPPAWRTTRRSVPAITSPRARSAR